MTRRDLFYSISGHVVFALALFIITPVSFGLWGGDDRLPLLMNVGIVDLPPGPRLLERKPKPKPKPPDPAPDDLPEIEPLEKLEKETIGEEAAADSTAEDQEVGEDSAEVLAVVDTATNGKTGEMSHTIADGADEGVDDIFGENVPAVGYGAADPYFQSLFLAIQRSFRNPVPGYKPIRCVVTFTVMNSGEIREIKLETSSGIPRFDRAAVRAIERIEWGRPFPKKFDDYDGYYIRMPFEYVPQ